MRRSSTRLAGVVLAIGALMPVAVPPTVAQSDGERLTRLQGTAALDRRRRVTGAVVKVQPAEEPSRLYLTSTDEDGAFMLQGMPEGAYTVALERAGLVPVVKSNVTLKFPFRAVVEVTMTPVAETMPAAARGAASATGGSPIALTGAVTDRDGEPLSEVRLRAVHPDGELDPHDVQSGADGRFAVEDLPAGRWQLEVDGVGFLSLDAEIELQQDTELRVVLVRQPADYEPSPIELMPPEKLIAPAGLEPQGIIER